MPLLSFDRVLKIILMILNILSYAINLFFNPEGKVEPPEEEE